MKRCALSLLLIGLSVLFSTPPARAEGWSLSNLLPGGSKPSTQTSSKNAKSPSLFTQLSNGTRRVVKGTQNTLAAMNPFASKSKPAGKSQKQSSTYAKAKPKKKSDSVLTSWFQPAEPEPPKTVGDFMRLKRLDP